MATRPLTGNTSDQPGRVRDDHAQTAAPPVLGNAVKARPVELLRLGGKALYFHEAGFHTLGDLAADEGVGRVWTLPGIGLKTARLVSERLADIRDSAAKNVGEPDWDGIAASWGFNSTSGRAEQIYRLRTCIPRRSRPTLHDIAVALATHGPTVKREETVLLASLHTQLVEGDMTDAAVVWRPNFFSFFRIAKELHEFVDGDYNLFCSSLGRQWKSDPDWVREKAEGLWAVLSLYLGGRRARPVMNRSAAPARVRKEASLLPPAPGGIVVLRGFRRPH